MDKKRIRQFNTILFRWFAQHQRPMAWRLTYDPYRILVSELMLQQTQVERVRTKYDEFIAQFPDVQALARAPLSAVLSVWSGLGYNRRARYLHACARVVVDEYGGKFPSTYHELVALPGIGRSTAGALLAFSFGQETPMIDTNIRRILTRVFFSDARQRPTDKELYDLASSIIPKGKGREWNYAMLDVGALVCTARRHSAECPLVSLHGKVDDFVYKKPQSTFKGSRRSYRGKIMRLLVERQRVAQKELSALIGLSDDVVSSVVTDLVAEGMVCVRRGVLSLPV